MTHLDYDVLCILTGHRTGVVSAGRIAELAGVTPSRLSQRLRVLEDRGDVRRRLNKSDARGVDVVIRSSGRSRVKALESQTIAEIRRLVFNRLSLAGISLLAEELESIREGITTPQSQPESRSDLPDPSKPVALRSLEFRESARLSRLSATFDPLLD